MANAVQVFNHRYQGFFADTLNQALATTRHDHIHIITHANQLTHRRTVGGFNHLYNIGWQSGTA